jgi:amidohydrolase
MIKEGVLQDPKPDAVFGLHVWSGLPSGRIGYRGGPSMASADEFRIKVTGRQGHAGYPWRAVDPVTTAAQIVLGLQTVVSRRTDLMKSPTVVSVTTINGGSRFNIVPDTVEMTGTIRTYDADVRAAVHRDIRQIAENIAASANARHSFRRHSHRAPIFSRAIDRASTLGKFSVRGPVSAGKFRRLVFGSA